MYRKGSYDHTTGAAPKVEPAVVGEMPSCYGIRARTPFQGLGLRPSQQSLSRAAFYHNNRSAKKITRTNVRSTIRLGSHTLTGWHASVLTAPSLRSAQVRASAFGDKKKKRHELWFVSFLFGSECWARTSDNLINSQVLCQLS